MKLGRKFWIAIGASALTIVLLLTNQLNAGQWIDIFKWILITFVAGNVGEHFTERNGQANYITDEIINAE